MNTTVDLRKRNTLGILKIIAEKGPITKTDAMAETGLTLVTVNTIINNLLKKGLIICDGIAESRGGRKAALYKLNSRAYYLAGINIGIERITAAISDLSLDIVKRASIDVKAGSTVENTIKAMGELVLWMVEDNGINSLIGLGITVPGPVNPSTGLVGSFPNLPGWEGVELKAIMESFLGLPVCVEKDVYASVLYQRKGIGDRNKNVVSLTVKGGIGTGILVDGIVYRGENGIAGEIGHIPVEMGGPRCNCGNYGCLEVYASDYAIARNVRKRIEEGESSIAFDIVNGEIERIDIDTVIKAACEGDALCRNSILSAARYLGIAISNLIKSFDPGLIILECKWAREVEGVLDYITGIVKEKSTLIQKNKISIQVSHDDDTYLKGAFMLVYNSVFENTEFNRFLN